MSTQFVRAGNVLSRELQDAVLVMARGGPDVLSLSGAGTEIWRLLGTPVTFEQLLRRLSDHFRVPVESIDDDVHRTLERLVEARLVHRAA